MRYSEFNKPKLMVNGLNDNGENVGLCPFIHYSILQC